MIWIGRLISIPLAIVFFALLVLTLVIVQVNDTFLDPDYYPRELREANVYEFVLGDLLTSALDEARELDGADFAEDLDENPLVTIDLSTNDIVSSVNRAVPPEWIQDLVEQSFDQFGHYLTGERDEFTVTIQAGDQVVTMVSEVKSLLRKANAYELLFDELVNPFVDEALDQELPLGLDSIELTSDRLVSAVRTTVPPEWVQSQVESVLDEVTPYVVGDRDTFEIRIQLADRVEVALEEVKKLLRETDAFDLLYEEVVAPRIVEAVGDSIQLPSGITVTNDEILSALRRVAPPDWVQLQAEKVIDEAGPYLSGEVDDFFIDVSLVDNKREARVVLAELVDAKFREILEVLPPCTEAQTRRLAARDGFEGTPDCKPAGEGFADLAGELRVEVTQAAIGQVLDAVPNDIKFTEANLRQALQQVGAEENLDRLDDVRELLRDGWTYTDLDLREDLANLDSGDLDGQDILHGLDTVREFLAEDGWTYTHVDFREDLVEVLDEDGLDEFDRFRDRFAQAHRFRWLIYVPMVILLIIIGFLSGRGWAGRATWASALLALSAGILLVLSGPVYDNLAEPRLDDLQERILTDVEIDSRFENTERLATDKVLELAESVVDGFASGIAASSRTLLVIGLVVLVISVGWSMIFRRRTY